MSNRKKRRYQNHVRPEVKKSNDFIDEMPPYNPFHDQLQEWTERNSKA